MSSDSLFMHCRRSSGKHRSCQLGNKYLVVWLEASHLLCQQLFRLLPCASQNPLFHIIGLFLHLMTKAGWSSSADWGMACCTFVIGLQSVVNIPSVPQGAIYPAELTRSQDRGTHLLHCETGRHASVLSGLFKVGQGRDRSVVQETDAESTKKRVACPRRINNSFSRCWPPFLHRSC